MAFQNSYNNYISRQKRNSTGLFKEKIKNSLGGVAVGNNTTLNKTSNVTPQTGATTVTPNVLGKSTTANISKNANGVPKVNLTTPTAPITGSRSVSTPYQMNAHINAKPIQPNISKGQIGGVKDNINTSGQTVNPLQPTTAVQPVENVTATPVTPTTDGTIVDNSATGGTTGMISLSDINNALSIDNNQANQQDDMDVLVKEVTGEDKPSMEFTEEDYKAMDELANNPYVQSGARASDKTPQQLAQELITMQKEQLQKDWEQKKAELELQMKQAKDSYTQSVTDANNTYKETDEELKLNRYQQQEDLAVDAQRRGIQYSPQQLALENVANINLNKNLADASKKRNELLNNLQIQINQSMENILMGLQSATNTYTSNVSDLMSDYQKQMMDWAYNDQQTESDRKWQEEQTKADQAFQKEMAELQNKWQAEQNALDRKTYGSSKSGGGGYGYGGRGYYRSYRPWRNYGYGRYGYARNNWRNYGGSYGSFSDNVDLNSEEGQEAVLSTAKQLSTDVFNGANFGSPTSLDERAQVYKEEMGNILNEVKGMSGSKGVKKKVVDELEKTYNVAINHLFNESFGRVNGTYKVGDTYKVSKTPYSEEYKAKMRANRMAYKNAYVEKYGLRDENGKLKPSSRQLASVLTNPEYFDPVNGIYSDYVRKEWNKKHSSKKPSSVSNAKRVVNNFSLFSNEDRRKLRGSKTLSQAEKERAIKSIQGKNFSLMDMAKQQKNAINAKSKNKKGVNTNNMRKTNKNAPSFAPKKAVTKSTKKSSNKKKTTKKTTKKKVVKKQSTKSALSKAWTNFRKHVLRF